MKIGIAIDPWKLDTFKQHLDKAGYEYKVVEGDPMTAITLHAATAEEVAPIIQMANKAARKKRAH